jgi:hypothetical protein
MGSHEGIETLAKVIEWGESSRSCARTKAPSSSPRSCGGGWGNWDGTAVSRTGKPWEHACRETFKGKLRDEGMNRESFCSLEEVQTGIEL